jgi:hypothetical protein
MKSETKTLSPDGVSSRRASRVVKSIVVAMAAFFSAQSAAANYIGTIEWIEVWPNGNVAFRLSNVTLPCTPQQFVLNASRPGTKNMYALLVALKAQGTTVTISSSSCGPAEGYGANYALVDYMYYY